MSVNIDITSFERRASAVFKYMDDRKFSALCIALGPTDEANNESEASSFFHWLLGFEFPDSLIAFHDGSVSFLSSKKKIDLLQQLKSSKISTAFFTRNKDDETMGYTAILRDIREKSKVGCLSRSMLSNDFASKWMQFLNDSHRFVVEVVNSVSSIWEKKDPQELEYISYAGQFCEILLSEVILESLKKNFNTSVSVLENKLLASVESKSSILSKILPKSESADFFELSKCELLPFKTHWVVSLDCKYKSYHACLSRSILSSSCPDEIRDKCDYAYQIRNYLHRQLKVGTQFKSIQNNVKNWSNENCPGFGPSFGDNFGHGVLCLLILDRIVSR